MLAVEYDTLLTNYLKLHSLQPLDPAKQKELNQALQGFLKKGEKLNLNLAVDPAVLGGMVVEIGDKYVDMSTATKVKQMTNLIEQSV